MPRTGWTTHATALLLVLGTAACGSGDGATDSASPEDWADSAGRLCQDWADDVTSIEGGVDADTTAQVAERTEAFADDLRDLGQPVDITEEAAAFVEAVGFRGGFDRCDELYEEAPDSDAVDSFQHYAATCGGRLEDQQPGECEALAG